MIRTKKYRMTLSLDDEVDVVIQKKNGEIYAFSVNYRTNINGKWHDVIRYDSAHRIIHVQKFWISPKVIPIRRFTFEDMEIAVIEAVKDVKENWMRYREYLIKKVRK